DINQASFSFQDLIGQDKWAAFTPSFSLTVVGETTYSGRLKIIGRQCFFQVKFSAATSIASTAGTHYLTLPITAKSYSGTAVMTDDTTNIAIGVCHIDVSNSRCYLPTQAASGDTFTLAGWFEI
ncbi:MAG TPA: hypothetical protein VIY48_03245, partial [Candidatus Paceibacterota bacterium]